MKIFEIKHENLLECCSTFQDDTKTFFKLEYCDGGSLIDVMEILDRTLTEIEICAALKLALKGLACLNANGFIHHSLKTGNILVSSNGNVKVGDAHFLNYFDDNTPIDDRLCWYSPEKITSYNCPSEKEDSWAVGLIALYLYSGCLPWDDLPVSMKILKIPLLPPPKAPDSASQLFKDFVSRILVKNPDERPTIEEILNDPFLLQLSDESSQEIMRTLVSCCNQIDYYYYEEEEEAEMEEEEKEVE
ncbi:STE family protein kinase [Tritrichomonas foetus]|uniref:STE family protein kinase n=1 Tax=Tritrichomonas foetus TaxID=1144522 RepID=A0A1J4KM91_9EUKA|nr:STE family protein kinase [Tritrichomonas foetus]|eukprot:OHT12258.1 STE family protein kinase [Tritrichomonas foetus]